MGCTFSQCIIRFGLNFLSIFLVCGSAQAGNNNHIADSLKWSGTCLYRDSFLQHNSSLLFYQPFEWDKAEAQRIDDIKSDALSPLVPDCWQELSEKLIIDGLERDWVEEVFKRLGNGYTDVPMKTKLKELYKLKFGKKKTTKPARENKTNYYRHVVTEKNVRRAMIFLHEHEEFFLKAEATYGVPKEVALSLILVETDLGSYLGRHSALLNLASMATSNRKETFYPHLPAFSGDLVKENWLQSVLDKRSKWAYNELKALLTYTYSNGFDPLELSGSIYGAIGYCQFMPSNIILFGVDGNNDGTINLFDPADAIFSLSNYLAVHGWPNSPDEAAQRKALLAYNRSTAYANTILMMAKELVNAEQQAMPNADQQPKDNQ